MRILRDPGAGEWAAKWLRRGELLTVAGVTSALTFGASGRWWPLIPALAVAALGIYVILAAESGWWLPGRARERDARRTRIWEESSKDTDVMQFLFAAQGIERALRELAQAVKERLRDEGESDV